MTWTLIFLGACFLLIGWTVGPLDRRCGVRDGRGWTIMGLTTALERGRTADVIICLVYAAAMALVGFLRTKF